MTPIFSTSDEQYMRRALQLADLARYSTSPNPRVGCVIVRHGQIVGEGFHVQAGTPHAEVHALRQAGQWARGADVFVTLEPCAHHGRTPPCAEALMNAGVARVVAAMRDPNPLVAGKGLAMLAGAGIAVQCGLLENEARVLNRGFLSKIERHRPFVRAKIAMSLDGKTALSDGRSKWITGDTARADVQHLRAESCAVLTGIGTVLADNPRLNVRDFPVLRQPVRVVLDTHFRLPEESALIHDGAPVWVFTHADIARQMPDSIRVFRLPEENERINLQAVLHTLAAQGIGELMVEAGATLTSAFLRHDLVDELVVYQSPKILGSAARGAFLLPEEGGVLTQSPRWQTDFVGVLGDDVKWVLRKKS